MLANQYKPLLLLVLMATGCGSNPISKPPEVAYAWDLPAWLPPPPVPADNPMTPAKVRLGEKLFADTRLSFNGTTSCASCHKPDIAFTDGKARSVGASGEPHRRGAMSLINTAYLSHLGWADTSIRSIEDQIQKVLYNIEPVELGWSGHRDAILGNLAVDLPIAKEFRDVFGGNAEPVSEARVIQALASYVRSLMTADSAYDRWVYFDDPGGLSPAARRGMRLFFSADVGCSNCHTGPHFGGPVAPWGELAAPAHYANTGLGNSADQGLFEQTGRPEDRGRFRVVSLRNIALTAPYMHDGRYATLEAVVQHYAGLREQRGNASLDAALVLFDLNPAERQDLVAFLHTL